MAQPLTFIQKSWSGLGRAKRLLVIGVSFLILWVLLFDSHSIVDRVVWSREAAVLSAENDSLQSEIRKIKDDLSHANDPDVIEQVARETYGMRKPGETVYRVEEVAE